MLPCFHLLKTSCCSLPRHQSTRGSSGDDVPMFMNLAELGVTGCAMISDKLPFLKALEVPGVASGASGQRASGRPEIHCHLRKKPSPMGRTVGVSNGRNDLSHIGLISESENKSPKKTIPVPKRKIRE